MSVATFIKCNEYECDKRGGTKKITLGDNKMAMIHSKNYPNKYPRNYKCGFRFNFPRGSSVSMKCSNFDIKGTGDNCRGGFFQVRESITGRNEKFCGQYNPFDLYLTNEDNSKYRMWVILRTHRRQDLKANGFNCSILAGFPDEAAVPTTTPPHQPQPLPPTVEGPEITPGCKCGILTSEADRIVSKYNIKGASVYM